MRVNGLLCGIYSCFKKYGLINFKFTYKPTQDNLSLKHGVVLIFDY